MRFGRSAAPVEADPPPQRQEPVVRHARKDGQLIAVLRAVDQGSSYVVDAEVYPRGTMQLVRPGPYTFGGAKEATTFMAEAVAALMYLGCDVQ